MWLKIIEYFSKQHLLSNFIVIIVFIGGIFFWHHTGKEELPDISFDRINISVNYPGASPEDVEHFVTKPIEEDIRGIDGVYTIRSTSSVGSCNITVELEPNYSDRDEAISEIKNTVLEVKLPEDIIDEPRIREFKTSKMAIIDVALIYTDKHLLDNQTRNELQSIVYALENQLISLSEVNSINRSGYLQKEIQIKAKPKKLLQYNIPFNTVMKVIKDNNIRQPAGSIESDQEEKVTLQSELDNTDELKELIVQGGFEGHVVRLKDVASVQEGFRENNSILKINGHEGIILNVVKNSAYGILQAIDAIKKKIEYFNKNNLKDSPIKIILLDDESIGVRSRLSLIGINGAIGFILILTMLFLFLNFKSGIWVALGIPFTFCFSMVMASLAGFTINNITLAAVIIVMGMIVDDAIVVSENITRLESQGMEPSKAVVQGTANVFLPIVASIVTTCVAFIPLFFFSGRFAKMTTFIPPIIFFMLGGSLFESVFILPAHMNLKIPRIMQILLSFGTWPLIEKYFIKKKKNNNYQMHWFHAVEERYGKILEKILFHKKIVFSIFILLLIFSVFLYKGTMKFVLFPNEETTQINLEAMAGPETKKIETAHLSQQIENIFKAYIGKEVIGFRTSIAESRRGSAVEENKMSMRIEIVSKEERKKSLNQLIKEWEEKFKKVKGFTKITFQRQRFGQSSGSPIDILIQENNNGIREKVANEIAESLKKHPALIDIEIERPLYNPEYKISLKRDKVKRLGINPTSIGSTLRALLEGSVLYEITEGDEEIDVRFTAEESAKDDIKKVLNVPVENQGNYLVPLIDIINIKKVISPNSIKRDDLKRTTSVYAGIREKADKTPLEIADYFENNIFPTIMARYPTTLITFSGEVKDTRESKSDFLIAIILVIFLIYIILALLFNSLYKPILIMVIIPFGVVGIILAFWLHGITLFGFFAGIGALGLAGVVINDSIVMLVKLDQEYDRKKHKDMSIKQIANTAKTRLRAVLLTTLTTVAGLLPTAYGFAGYDAMLAEMMLALAWGLMFGTVITLILMPSLYSFMVDIKHKYSSLLVKLKE